MVSFVPIDPRDVPRHREGRRGRISYPLLKGFLEANIPCARIDLTGLNKKPEYLRSVLYAYINSHNLPIKVFAASGDLYLARLDMDDDGNIDPNWSPDMVTTEGDPGAERDFIPQKITAEEVNSRFGIERSKFTK